MTGCMTANLKPLEFLELTTNIFSTNFVRMCILYSAANNRNIRHFLACYQIEELFPLGSFALYNKLVEAFLKVKELFWRRLYR